MEHEVISVEVCAHCLEAMLVRCACGHVDKRVPDRANDGCRHQRIVSKSPAAWRKIVEARQRRRGERGVQTDRREAPDLAAL